MINQNVPISQVPEGAIALPQAAVFAGYRAAFIQSVTAQVEAQNQSALNAYISACANWAINADRSRSLGAPLPPKPVQPIEQIFNVSETAADGAIYVWQVSGSPMGSPCPDLPPVPAKTSGLDIGPFLIREPEGDYYTCPQDDTTPTNTVVSVSSGQTFASGASVPAGQYRKIGSMFPSMNWWLKVASIMLACVLGLMAVSSAYAQVNIACSPQPMAATRSIAEKSMGPWQCWVTNDGAAAYTLTPSKFFQAIMPIRPVGPNIASQIVADAVGRLPQSKLVRGLKIGASIGSIAYGIYSGSVTVPLAVNAGLQVAPQVIAILDGEVPSGAPFLAGQFVAPVTIAPGADIPPVLVYAAKTKAPAPLVITIPAGR